MKKGGPKTAEGKARASQNATKHGLLSRSLRFKSPEEAARFEVLFRNVKDAVGASDRVEELLAEDVAIGFWRISEHLPLEQNEMRRRKNTAALVRDVLLAVSGRCSSDLGEKVEATLEGKLPAGECRYMALQLSKGGAASKTREEGGEAGDYGDSETEKNLSRNSAEMKLELGDGLPTLLRYNAVIRRDLDRALDRLKRWRELKHQGDITKK